MVENKDYEEIAGSNSEEEEFEMEENPFECSPSCQNPCCNSMEPVDMSYLVELLMDLSDQLAEVQRDLSELKTKMKC